MTWCTRPKPCWAVVSEEEEDIKYDFVNCTSIIVYSINKFSRHTPQQELQ
jgi:hypothetical protein